MILRSVITEVFSRPEVNSFVLRLCDEDEGIRL